ncbi:S1 RNA-binding domain-containing protein [Streptomyces sp. NPDC058463]|uniref:S1 RNA-binding domain-containing protein n=1 Tax=Streptomyces sp. NPDC058463 TaxID=3346510 RepID=UPI0036581BA9
MRFTAVPDQAGGTTRFGVTFVGIGGFTAMINIPELSWRRIDSPSDVDTVGQEITVKILDVDPTQCRITLSHKQELTVAPKGHRHS